MCQEDQECFFDCKCWTLWRNTFSFLWWNSWKTLKQKVTHEDVWTTFTTVSRKEVSSREDLLVFALSFPPPWCYRLSCCWPLRLQGDLCSSPGVGCIWLGPAPSTSLLHMVQLGYSVNVCRYLLNSGMRQLLIWLLDVLHVWRRSTASSSTKKSEKRKTHSFSLNLLKLNENRCVPEEGPSLQRWDERVQTQTFSSKEAVNAHKISSV